MSRRTVASSTLTILLAIAACSSTAPDPVPRAAPSGDTPATVAADADWAQLMKEVDRRYEVLKDNLTHQPLGDLRAVATAAGEAAELMRLGYGRFEDPTVPGFARMARETETWFLNLALEARQAHGDIARELFLAQRKRHCGDCHDAHERVHG